MNQACRILLVDDHCWIREGLRARLQACGDYQVCAEAASVEEAMGVLAQTEVDIVITDLRLGAGSGADLLAAIAAAPELQCAVVVLTMHDDLAFVKRMLSLGAMGYLLKDDPAAVLMQALEHVRNEQVFLSPSIAQDALGEVRARVQLSPKEVEVLQLLAQGLSSKLMAEQMATSVRTVESHRLRLRRKLHLDGPDSLARYAQTYAVLEPQRLA